MNLNQNKTKLNVYSEGTKKNTYVGQLSLSEGGDYFFEYSRAYLKSKGAIPIGPELPLTKIKHRTKDSKLFPSFLDRIPSKSNPAYVEYCENFGISPEEKNYFILLTTIGRRGPSTFIFDPIYETEEENISEQLRIFRKETGASLRIVAELFDLNYVTLQRIETGLSEDKRTIRLLHIYLNFPEVAIWAIHSHSSGVADIMKKKIIPYLKSSKVNGSK